MLYIEVTADYGKGGRQTKAAQATEWRSGEEAHIAAQAVCAAAGQGLPRAVTVRVSYPRPGRFTSVCRLSGRAGLSEPELYGYVAAIAEVCAAAAQKAARMAEARGR